MNGCKYYDRQIPVRDDTIRVRVYKPNIPNADGGPLIVMFHGGGFCIGDVSRQDRGATLLSTKFHATCVSIGYRLAPEHPFPSAIHDAWDALQWAATHATTELNADPSKGFFVTGISAGGTLAALVTRLARDNGLEPPLTGAHVSIANLTHWDAIPPKYEHEYLSHVQNADAPVYDAAMGNYFASLYKADPRSPLHNILLQDESTHVGLPPHVFQVAGFDPLRDGPLIYQRELEKVGTPTRLILYRGLPHWFWGLFPQLSQSKNYWVDFEEAFAWLLSGEQGVHHDQGEMDLS